MRIILILILTLQVTQAFSQEPQTEAETSATIFISDENAIKVVLEDLYNLPTETGPFVRYLVAPPGVTADWIHGADYIINAAVSKSRTLQEGVPLAGFHVIRYDLRELVRDAEKLARLIELWDGLSVLDPYYHINQKTADQSLILGIQAKFFEPSENIPVSIIAPHIEQILVQLTTQRNFSPALAYRFDFFLNQVFSAENQYYDFLQIPSKREGESDFDAILGAIGIDRKQIEQLNSERRVAIFASGVTSRPRRVDTFVGNGGLRAWVTLDIAEDSILANQHPIYSLLRFFPDAKEAIIENSNGTHSYYLFNEKNELQKVVPDNVARDGTIPFPFPARLTPGISCIRCHAPNGGLHPVKNDVEAILTSGFTVFDDINSDLSQLETVDRLEALYSGRRFQIYLDRGRLDHEAASLEITGNPGIPPFVSPFSLIATELSSIWSRHNYTYVDAQMAYLEVTGKVIEKEQAIDELAKILGKVDIEDPGIAALLSGLEIRRSDFERIITTCALRYVNYKKSLLPKPESTSEQEK